MKVWDLHCDTLSELRYAQLEGKPKAFDRNDLHIDLEKLTKGDYYLQCLAAFINLGRQKNGENSVVAVLELADLFHRIIAKYPDRVAPVYTAQDIAKNEAAGKISLMLTIEEGGCCKGSLGVMRELYALGARMMTLTWNYPNELANPNVAPGDAADILPCRANTETGLTETGLAFLSEMERLHMIVDVSHLSDKGFWDVVEHARRPFAASHSNCRALSPHCRNLTDEMIRAMAERGGLVGLNYCAGFLEPDPSAQQSTVDRIAEHAQHFKKVGGIDMIALGSDFDGIEHGPGMKNCADLPMLEQALRRSGFTEDEIEAIFYRNAKRFFTENL
jgi:membrane dipeptidase